MVDEKKSRYAIFSALSRKPPMTATGNGDRATYCWPLAAGGDMNLKGIFFDVSRVASRDTAKGDLCPMSAAGMRDVFSCETFFFLVPSVPIRASVDYQP